MVDPDESASPTVPLEYLGDYDAMVLMRGRDKELCFVMKRDMSEERFIVCCRRLRELILGPDHG